ncbi:sugar ABC transporter permease, partial [Rhizobium ruizarguesonis]
MILSAISTLLTTPFGSSNRRQMMALNIINFKVEWFSSTRTAIHALTFANIWAGYTLYMVSLLAGLQGISKELYEAAGIDGANEL